MLLDKLVHKVLKVLKVLKVQLVLMDRMVLQVHKDRPAPLEAEVALLQVR